MDFLFFILLILGAIIMIALLLYRKNQQSDISKKDSKKIYSEPSISDVCINGENFDKGDSKDSSLEKDYYFIYSKKIGVYNNWNNKTVVHTCVVKDGVFNAINVYNAISEYYEADYISNYIVQFRTKRLLSSNEEELFRRLVKKCGGSMALQKDISSFSQELPDIHTITVKISFDYLKNILFMVENDNINSINIVDDYNPTIFTYRDIIQAFNYNYRIKLYIELNKDIINECRIMLNYGIVENTQQFLVSMSRLIGGNNSQIVYYKGLLS